MLTLISDDDGLFASATGGRGVTQTAADLEHEAALIHAATGSALIVLDPMPLPADAIKRIAVRAKCAVLAGDHPGEGKYTLRPLAIQCQPRRAIRLERLSRQRQSEVSTITLTYLSAGCPVPPQIAYALACMELIG